MKEIFIDYLERTSLEQNQDITLDEDYIDWIEATHLKTQILSTEDQWKDAYINLRDYNTVSPLLDPNRTKLSTGNTSIIINTPFITTQLQWKKVKSNR